MRAKFALIVFFIVTLAACQAQAPTSVPTASPSATDTAIPTVTPAPFTPTLIPTATATQTPTATPTPSAKVTLKSAMAAAIQVIAYDEEAIVGTGSGSVLTTDGFILTNAHVVGDMKKRQLSNRDGRVVIAVIDNPRLPAIPRFIAEVCQIDFDLDIALVKPISGLDGRKLANVLRLSTVPIGDSDTVEIGDQVVAVGFPGIGGDSVTVTRGIVSGFGTFRRMNGIWIKTDILIGPGNSGGMVISETGELIGIPTMVITDDTSFAQIGLVRPVNQASSLIKAAVGGQALPGAPSTTLPTADQGITVTGKVIDLDTYKPINGALFVVLKPGIAAEEFENNPSDSTIAAMGRTDELGQFQTTPMLERGQVYSVTARATGYRTMWANSFFYFTSESPATIDLGVIRMQKR